MKKILIELKLDQYIEIFEEEGIKDTDTFHDYEDADLLELGLKKPHIKRLKRHFEELTDIDELGASFVENRIEKKWFQFLSEDNSLWVEELLNDNVPVISHEYKRIKKLITEGQYFGALLQIKDFFEILIKLPTIIILNEKFNLDEYNEEEKKLIITTLEKPLSLGHWHEIATIIKKHTLFSDEEFSKFILNTIKLYNKNDIIKWRNDEIGHGALSLDDDIEFQEDIKDKLLIIKKFLDNNISILTTIEFDTNENTVRYGQTSCPIEPFFKFIDNKVYFFDSYLSRKQKVHQLNYCYGKKLVSEIDEFNNFISQYKMDKRDSELSTCNLDEVRLAEEEKQLDLLEQSTEFIKPTYLIEWIENSLDSFKKGKFLLQMQRGTGKSLFCKALDQLALNKIELDSDPLVRSFYINDVFRSSLSDFTSEISYFILNKKISSNNLIDVFKGNLPTLDIDSSKSDFAYLLNWYKQKYDVDKLLLIIDGVDEIPQSDEKTIFDILPDRRELNDGIYLLVTSRTNREITNFTKEKLEELSFEDKKRIQKDSVENIETLKSYIDKYKLTKDETQIESLIQKSDYRILYLNMLKEILLSTNIDFDDIPSSEQIIDFYLSEVKKKYGEKYFQTIFNILIILSSQQEELTIKEIAYLNNDANISLKLIANLFDLRGLIKKTRSDHGNKFSLNHILLSNYLNKKFKSEIIDYLQDIYQNIDSFNSNDEADVYKMSYLQKYENLYNISLSKDLKSDQVLSFLIRLKNSEIHKEVKIAILLYKLNIDHFFDYFIKKEKENNIIILLQILEKLKLFGDTKNTIRIIEMIIHKFDSKSEEYLKLYETLCDMTHLIGEYEKAANFLEKLVNTVEEIYGKDSKLYIKYSIRIAHHRMFFSDINLPWNRMVNLLDEVDFEKYKNEYAEIMFMLGGNLAALKGNFREGIDYLLKTVEIGKAINDNYLLSRCMRKLSDYYRFYNDMKKADTFCAEGISYTDDEITNRQRIYLYSTQAENFRKHGEYDKAIEYFEYCKKLSSENNIKGWVANSILGLSETYRLDNTKQNNNDYLFEALEIYEKINMNWGIVHIKIAIALNRTIISKKILNEALDLAIKSNYSKDIEYIDELLKFNTISDLSEQHLYHELMFL